jgi:hypothetical protein
MSAEDAAIFYELIKSSSKQVVKNGGAKMGLPANVASGIADQISCAFDLVKKGATITPANLALVLFNKGLGIAKIAAGKEYACGIAILTLSTAVINAAFFTTFSGPGYAVVKAISLVSDCYAMDKSCGISDAVVKKIDDVVDPAYMWLDTGIVQWISHGGM